MDIQILVAMHKPYWAPLDETYLPLQVGALGKPSLHISNYPAAYQIQRDDEGFHISGRNPVFCELTGLYWAWKNSRADYVGSVHYRRYFVRKERPFFISGHREDILTKDEWVDLLSDVPIVLPKKRHYYIESIASHYRHAHDAVSWQAVGDILEEIYPAYSPCFADLDKRRSAHLFNMFVMRKDYFDQYCAWLFAVLFSLEKRLPQHEPRLFGFLAERLLDVWIDTNRLPYKEVPAAFMERRNWGKKIGQFLWRKMRKGK